MQKLWSWSPGGLLMLLSAACAWAWHGALTVWRWIWMAPAPLPTVMAWCCAAPTPRLGERDVRPVSDQRPYTRRFTLPQNTFAF